MSTREQVMTPVCKKCWKFWLYIEYMIKWVDGTEYAQYPCVWSPEWCCPILCAILKENPNLKKENNLILKQQASLQESCKSVTAGFCVIFWGFFCLVLVYCRIFFYFVELFQQVPFHIKILTFFLSLHSCKNICQFTFSNSLQLSGTIQKLPGFFSIPSASL